MHREDLDTATSENDVLTVVFMYYVYVIECATPNHYYIGLTQDFEGRIRRHMDRKGAKFTSEHGFKRVICKEEYYWEDDAKERESELTQDYIDKYGIENVAGAGWSQVRKGKNRGAGLLR